MSISTYEGVVKKGKIHLHTGIKLTENAKVYVIVTNIDVKIVSSQ